MLSTRKQKIEWLLAHPTLWEGWRDRGEQDRWKHIVSKMKEEGLVSIQTHWKDIHLPNLIYTARRWRRYKAAGLIP